MNADTSDWIPEWVNEGRGPYYPPLAVVPAPDPSWVAQRGTRSAVLDVLRDIVTVACCSTVAGLLLFLVGAVLDWW